MYIFSFAFVGFILKCNTGSSDLPILYKIETDDGSILLNAMTV